MKAKTMLAASQIYRRHGALQQALACITNLVDFVPEIDSGVVDISPLAQYELAEVLWAKGETSTAMKIMQNTVRASKSSSTDLPKCRSLTRLVS
jgi:serine-protein kinase ATM